MKIILFSIGTRGDIEPFLAIAQMLKEKGYDVICVFPEPYRDTVEAMGLAFRGFSKEIVELLDGNQFKIIFGNEKSAFKRMRLLAGMARVSWRLSKESLALQHRIQVEEQPDRILYHPKCIYSVLWGIAHPGTSILVNPTLDPLSDMGRHAGTVGSKIKCGLVYTAKAAMLKLAFHRYRDDYGGVKMTVSKIKRTLLQTEKTVYTLSPFLFTQPVSCPRNTHIVGHFERKIAPDWQPDQSLMQFIDQHEKIIYITLGSMSNPRPDEKTQMIINVLKRHNIAAIINVSGAGLAECDDPPDHVYFANSLPHSWLFPKIHATVHHGGAGTTHTSIKYGCPSLIIPHVLDQFFWEQTIAALRLGPHGIPIRKLAETEFERRLLDLYSNREYKQNASLLSKKMQSEHDETALCRLILSR